MLDIIEGIRVLHERSIVYQNISLGNIIKDTHDSHFKLRFSSFREIDNFNARKHSDHYTAPEVLRSEGFDCSADIFALGILFIELITG
jgi:serine/threonine protein kinase